MLYGNEIASGAEYNSVSSIGGINGNGWQFSNFGTGDVINAAGATDRS